MAKDAVSGDDWRPKKKLVNNEELSKYIAQREQAAAIRIFRTLPVTKKGKPIRPTVTQSTKRFKALRWGKNQNGRSPL